jgi:hypothetical protein
MENLRPNAQRAKIAMILVSIVFFIRILSLISDYFQYDLLQRAASGGVIDTAEANANDTRQALLAVLYTIAFTVSAITFIQWFRRAYYNIELKGQIMSQTDGWAAGAWFVPIICLYRPFKMMKELFVETDEYLEKQQVQGNRSSFWLIGVWWTFWILVNLLGQIEFRLSYSAKTISELTSSTSVSIMGDILFLPLSVLTLLLIWNYSKKEVLLVENEMNQDLQKHQLTVSVIE